MTFLSFKSLPLRKQHYETTTPRSLVQKTKPEGYLEFLNRIMV